MNYTNAWAQRVLGEFFSNEHAQYISSLFELEQGQEISKYPDRMEVETLIDLSLTYLSTRQEVKMGGELAFNQLQSIKDQYKNLRRTGQTTWPQPSSARKLKKPSKMETKMQWKPLPFSDG